MIKLYVKYLYWYIAKNVWKLCWTQVVGGVRVRDKVSTSDGLIGMLERGEVDIAITDLSLTLERAQAHYL